MFIFKDRIQVRDSMVLIIFIHCISFKEYILLSLRESDWLKLMQWILGLSDTWTSVLFLDASKCGTYCEIITRRRRKVSYMRSTAIYNPHISPDLLLQIYFFYFNAWPFSFLFFWEGQKANGSPITK